MADGCRLPKVIVVLALLSRIGAYQRDDLLDRVRESKSNEPEVRDFLKSVLQHHDVFRWISQEAVKFDHHDEAGILPLRGMSQKSKRSFHSFGSGDTLKSKPMTRYVYRHDNSFDDDDADEVKERDDDLQSLASNARIADEPHPSVSKLKQREADSLDFDGPVNDIYPYQEDMLDVPRQDRRFARETQDSFLYDDQRFDENDMLEGAGVGMEGMSGEVDQGEADFSGEDRHDRYKRSASTEALLNEKMLHRVLHKQMRTDDRFNRNGGKFKAKSLDLNALAFHMPGDAIEVIPSSLKGVRFAPGVKLEKNGELVKSEQDRYNQEDLEDLISREDPANSLKPNVHKRTCTDNPVESDFKAPEVMDANKSKGTGTDVDLPLSEFYFSSPHDVIGLNQEMMIENRIKENITCKKFRRDDQVERTVPKDQKAIRIKILDNDQVVQDVEKGKNSNSVILTIENPNAVKDPVVFEPAKSVTDRNTLDKEGHYTNTLPDNEDTEYTLTKIDNIIKPDQASLKQQTLTKPPKVFTQMTTDLILDDKAEISQQSGERMDHPEEVPVHLGKHQAHKQQHAKKYNRINEMGTTVIPLVGECSEYPQMLNYRTENYYRPQQMKHHPANAYQNRLEDQTEPTSAAEQRELGRINSVTDPLVQTTSEKVIIIPFKKSADKTMALEILVDSNLKDSEKIVEALGSDEERLPRELHEEEKGKRSKVDTLNESEDENEVYHNNQLKADAFRSRKLFSIQEEEEEEEDANVKESPADYTQVGPTPGTADPTLIESATAPAEDRKKKDVRTILGMRNDQDYSEDRTDLYGDDERSQKKITSKIKTKALEAKRGMEAKMRQRLLGSIINTQQERRALKVRLAKTKSNKFKKDTSSDTSEMDADPPGDLEDDVNNYHQGTRKAHEVHEDTNIVHRDARKLVASDRVKIVLHGVIDPFDKEAPEQPVRKEVAVKGGMDRCCENVKTPLPVINNALDDRPSSKFKDHHAKAKGKGNELDIIEKTQAILLHITGTPNQEFDNDVDEKKRDDQIETKDDSNLAVKHLNSYKVTDSEKNPENVVSEIIKLVQNYKNKVSEYNKNQNQNQNRNQKDLVLAKSTDRPKLKSCKNKECKDNLQFISHLPDIQQDRKELQQSQSERNNKNVKEFEEEFSRTVTTDVPLITSTNNDVTKVLSSDNEDESIHAHAIMHDKHLHPKKSNKCEHKQSQSNDEDFVAPKTIREGYIRTEVVADADPVNADEDANGSSPQAREAETVTSLEELPEVSEEAKQVEKRSFTSGVETQTAIIQKNVRVTAKVVKMSKRDNPLQFTPDSLVGFKEIVESRQESKDARNFNPELFIQNDSGEHEVYKRDLHDDDKEYSEEELDKLIRMVGESSKNAKHDQDLLKRYRRYKNFEPFYESLPRFRHSGPSDQNLITYATPSNLNDLSETNAPPVVQPSCLDVDKKLDRGEPPLLYHENKHKHKHHCHGHKIDDEEEFGDTSKLHADNPRKSKNEQRQEKCEREHIRARLYEEKEVEARKEQEHIRNVLNGHLILDIMLKFSNKVKENSRLNNRFGTSMSRKCAYEQVNLLDKFKEEQNRCDVRHAQLMLHQVIVLMNKIVAEQVYRRTCLLLSPALKDFLKHTVVKKQAIAKSSVIAEGFPLPAVKGSKNKDAGIDDTQGDFLFPADGGDEVEVGSVSPLGQAVKMKKKINMIRALLAKYDHMTHTCQIRVQPVHDYLIQHLHTLQRMYHNKQWGDVADPCGVECDLSHTTAGFGHGMSTMAIVTRMGSLGSEAPGISTLGPDVTYKVPVPPQPTKGVHTRAITSEPKKPNGQRLFRSYDDDAADAAGHNGEGVYPSDKYKRLVEAAADYRRKRQIEERLARLFGRTRTKKAGEEVATTHKREEGNAADLSNAAFEAPMVYSLH